MPSSTGPPAPAGIFLKTFSITREKPSTFCTIPVGSSVTRNDSPMSALKTLVIAAAAGSVDDAGFELSNAIFPIGESTFMRIDSITCRSTVVPSGATLSTVVRNS